MDLHARAAELVGVLTTSVDTQPQGEAMRRLKQVARQAPRAVFDAVLAAVRKKHAHVRFLALVLADALVMRSQDFRRLVFSSLPALLPLLLGYQPGSPLPAPADRAERLKEAALECLQRWELAFGAHYVQLTLAKRFVERSLRLLLPDLRERASRQERERRERRERTQDLLGAKFQSLRLEIPPCAAEMQAAVEELERCLELVGGLAGPAGTGDPTAGGDLPRLRSRPSAAHQAGGTHPLQQEGREQGPRPGAVAGGGFSARDGFEEASQGSLRSQMREAALASAEEEERGFMLAQARLEMPNVFQTLHDLFRMVDKRFLPLTAAWIATLSRFDGFARESVQERDGLLKKAIDLRSALKEVHARCAGAGLRVAPLDADTPHPDQGHADTPDPDQGQDTPAQHSWAGDQAQGLDAAPDPPPRSAAPGARAAAAEGLGPAPALESRSGIGLPGADPALEEGIEWEGDGLSCSATSHSAGIQSLQVASGAPNPSPAGFMLETPPGTQGSSPRALARGAGEAEPGVAAGRSAAPEEGLQGQASGHGGVQGAPAPGPGKKSPREGQGQESPGECGALSRDAQSKRARRQQLLGLAPRLPWGQHLDYWDAAAGGVPVNPRGMSFENHWGPVDEAACLPQERLRELTLMVTTYQPPAPAQPAARRGTHKDAACSHPAGCPEPQAARVQAAGAREQAGSVQGSAERSRQQGPVLDGGRRVLPEKEGRRAKTAASIRAHNDSVLAAAQNFPRAHGDIGSGAPAASPGAAPCASRKPSQGAALRAMLKVPTTSASRLATRAKEAGKRRRSGGPECDEAARDLSANQW